MFKLPKNRGLCAYFRDPRQDPLGSGGKLWFHATAHPTRLYLELTAAREYTLRQFSACNQSRAYQLLEAAAKACGATVKYMGDGREAQLAQAAEGL